VYLPEILSNVAFFIVIIKHTLPLPSLLVKIFMCGNDGFFVYPSHHSYLTTSPYIVLVLYNNNVVQSNRSVVFIGDNYSVVGSDGIIIYRIIINNCSYAAMVYRNYCSRDWKKLIIYRYPVPRFCF